MSAEQLATRIIAEQTGIPSNQIRRGGISESRLREASRITRSSCRTCRFYVDETGGLSVAQLAARARRLKRQRGLDLLVIDYLQLLQGSTRRSPENRVQEITEITTKLKALAKELNVPILALSQLSRQVESRDDKRPQLSDLRESGSIEQDADVVLFVYREEYYHQMRKPLESNREKFAEWLAEGRQSARQGRSHHRQAAPRPDRHGRTAVRRRGHHDSPRSRAKTACRSAWSRLACPWTGGRSGRLNPTSMAEAEPRCHPTCRPSRAAGARRPRARRAAEAGGILTIDLAAIVANWQELAAAPCRRNARP